MVLPVGFMLPGKSVSIAAVDLQLWSSPAFHGLVLYWLCLAESS